MIETGQIRRLSPDEARTLLHDGAPTVFDARDAASFQRGRIGDARPLSHGNLGLALQCTPRSKPVLIYCYRGRSAEHFAQAFAASGFAEVYSLDGGFEAWTAAD